MSASVLTSLDIACGMPLPDGGTFDRRRSSRRDSVARRPGAIAPRSPREGLESAIRPALLRAPCLVSFSGGRDSAAVLAVAAELARRERLPLPIPATNVFPTARDADESRWQELLMRHLGLSDWLRIEHDDELDLIGPYAQQVLRTHGVLWPPNTHFHLPLLEEGRGGSMLTGIGGDELYAAARRLPYAAVLARDVRPHPRHLLSAGVVLAPHVVRHAVLARAIRVEHPWLNKRAKDLAGEILAREASSEPRRLRARMEWWRQLRYLRVSSDALGLVARDCDVLLAHPLSSPSFWNAVAATAPRTGFASRTDGVRRLFGDALPPEIVERTSKTNFNHVFMTERTCAFAWAWDGTGVPEEWVDREALAHHWRGEQPSPQSGSLLQAAWLASARDGVEKVGRALV